MVSCKVIHVRWRLPHCFPKVPIGNHLHWHGKIKKNGGGEEDGCSRPPEQPRKKTFIIILLFKLYRFAAVDAVDS